MSPQARLLTRHMEADHGVLVGYPVSRASAEPLVLGAGARLRSGTVLYDGSTIGRGLQTGHGVVIREGCEVGDDVSVWTNSVIDYGCRIGDRVKIHCNCYVAQYSELEDDVFLAPGVTIANDLYPGDQRSAQLMAGPRIGAGAQIGVNVTILPFVRIGAGALIGAGSVVTRDIPAAVVAFGNPAVPRRAVAELPDIDERVVGHGRRAGTTGRRRREPAVTDLAARKEITAPRLGEEVVKRALDIALASVLIVLAAPLLLLLWCLVRSTSAGPALFRQERLGRDMRPFTMLKLRSMYVDNDDRIHRDYVTDHALSGEQEAVPARNNALFKLIGDPRVTPLGAWLRRTSLDELPQLINVLRGEMSLVGPRPMLPWEAQLLAEPYRRRFTVKPGITGLWQVSGRSRLSMRTALELDVEYARRRSVLLDLSILARTVPALFRGGAS